MSAGEIEKLAGHPLRIELRPGVWLRSAKTKLEYVIFRMSEDYIDTPKKKGMRRTCYPTRFEILEYKKTDAKAVSPADLFGWVESRQMEIIARNLLIIILNRIILPLCPFIAGTIRYYNDAY